MVIPYHPLAINLPGSRRMRRDLLGVTRLHLEFDGVVTADVWYRTTSALSAERAVESKVSTGLGIISDAMTE